MKWSRKKSTLGFRRPCWSVVQNCASVGRAVIGAGTCVSHAPEKLDGTERNAINGTHRLDVTIQGIVGYIDGLRLSRFTPSLDLVHRILVAGGAIYHICGRILPNKWDGDKDVGVGEGDILIFGAKKSGLSDGVEDAILEWSAKTASCQV